MGTKGRFFVFPVLLALLIAFMCGCGNDEKAGAAPSAGIGQASPENNVSPEKQTNTVKPAETSVLELNIKPFSPAPPPVEVTIPDIFIDPFKVPDNDAMRFVADLKIGWNLGNTFDAVKDNAEFDDELIYETLWCGVKTTREMISAVKDAGFNTVRIPVSWHNHVSGNDYEISGPWLERVVEVVDYVMDSGMYAIINIHHDISKEYYYPSSEYLVNSIKYATSIWKQLSERFKDYGERLVFESVNEPRLVGTKNEWWLDMGSEECVDAVECINKLNQAFVDAVRSTGGNNAERYLLIPGYTAAADHALLDEFKLPSDPAKNKIIVSVHAYTPYGFALQDPNQGGSTSEWSVKNSGSTVEIDSLMNRLYDKYTSRGTPVLIGEFGARDKSGNLQARVEHAAYYIRAARARGITCCWWDNNAFSGDGENFGLLDRNSVKWKYPDIVAAMMKYAE
jgi:endoglucanase